MVPLEITDENRVPSEKILVGTSFLTVISLRISCWEKSLPVDIHAIKQVP
jgi:hypothetical protein